MATLVRVSACLSLCCVLWKACGAMVAFPEGDGWEWMAGVAQMDGAQFMGFASPLVQMSANAYRYPDTLRSIPGWNLSSQIAPLHPSDGGAHALVFEEHSSCTKDARAHDLGPHHANIGQAFPGVSCADAAPRVVLAFRGTQLSASIDSLADVCADRLLWDGFDFGSLPSECLAFDPNTLDYFSQALNYTLQVIKLYPSVPILLTGHSLGAGLAVLVAGALSDTYTLPVIGFGAPGTRKPLLDRGISVKSLENGSVIVIGHEWDVIMRSQMEGQVGLLCFYPQTEPSSCKFCIPSSGLPFMSTQKGLDWSTCFVKREAHIGVHRKHCGLVGLISNDCMDCFFATHFLKVLIGVVNQGIKPVCHQAGSESFPWSWA